MSQTTKMITLLHLLIASALIESKFGFPDNVNFVTQLYNTSNCSNPSFKNFTLDNLCFKTSIVNGYPECCQELLSEINVFDNMSLGECINTNMTYTNRLGVKYDCNLTHFKQFSLQETFSYIGIILTLLLITILCVGIVCSLCGRKNSEYNMI
uniref:Uncharacterized protein n=1 Tax=viral metagenome TaxID=1070528 RepID=A0A6C0J8X8_9ZZZZ